MTTSKTYKRSASIDSNAIDVDTRTVTLSFSSEQPYQRHFGNEVLQHGAENVRTERLKNNAALLLDHDWSKQIGVVEKAWLEDGKGRAVVRFGKGAQASEIFDDVVDGIRKHISVGYSVHDMSKDEESGDHLVSDWEPLEISIVSVPADTSVGVGRSAENKTIIKKSEATMDKAQDVDLAQKGQDTERTRVNALLSIGKQFEAQDEASEFVQSGKSVEQFRERLLSKMHSESKRELKDNGQVSIGLSEKEAGQFSFQRALEYLLNPSSQSVRNRAAFEIEVSDAAQGAGASNTGGLSVPYDVLSKTLTMNGVDGDTSKASGTIKQNYLDGSFIDILNNRSVALQLATQMTNLVGYIKIPKQTKTSQSFWAGEKEAVQESDIDFDFVEMRPYTSGVATTLTHELVHNSASNVESIIRRDMATQAALAIDKAALYGTGKSQPLGIKNVKHILGHEHGGEMSFADFVAMEKAIASANADAGNMVFVMNPADFSQTKVTARGNGIQAPILEAGNTINGYRVETSNQVSAGDVFFGNFADLIVGTWGGIELTADNTTLAQNRIIRFFLHQNVDFAVRHPESFCLAVKKKGK